MKSYNGFRREEGECVYVRSRADAWIYLIAVSWRFWRCVEFYAVMNAERKSKAVEDTCSITCRIVISFVLSYLFPFVWVKLSCFVSVFYFEKEGIWSLSWGINKLKRNIRLVVRTRFYRWEDRSVVVSWKILKMNLETEIYIKQFRKTVFGRLDAMVK